VQDVDGKVKYQDVELFTSRFGGRVLTKEELKNIFTDFDQSRDGLVTKNEFFKFFSKISQRQNNADFDSMIDDMLN
jgi:Ca2+-binding EF-hand superfamily protein